VTVNTWAGDTFVFPFFLQAKDVAFDERMQVLKTSFGVFVDDTVTVGDVWDDVETNHLVDIFNFENGGTPDIYPCTSARRWMESAIELIFGLSVTNFNSYPLTDPALFGNVYDYIVFDAPSDGLQGYGCIDVDTLNVGGAPANNITAISVLQSLAGHEGGIFGSGFSTVFYANRASATGTPISITYDDVIELSVARNYTAFKQIQTGIIAKSVDTVLPLVPNLTTRNYSPVVTLNPNAEKSINIQLNAGFPVLVAGTIDFGLSVFQSPLSTNDVVDGALAGAQASYSLALPAFGALKITTKIYGWGKVKPWELVTFDSTCPARYQSKTFRINDVSYSFKDATTTITAYQIA
jgi:hypothetical protein